MEGASACWHWPRGGEGVYLCSTGGSPPSSVAGVGTMWSPDPRERKEIPKRLSESKVSGSLIRVMSFPPPCDSTSGSSCWNMLGKASAYPSHLP